MAQNVSMLTILQTINVGVNFYSNGSKAIVVTPGPLEICRKRIWFCVIIWFGCMEMPSPDGRVRMGWETDGSLVLISGMNLTRVVGRSADRLKVLQ